MTHMQLRVANVDHVVQNWDDTTDVYAEWIRIMHKHETTETYKIRMLGTQKGRCNFPELSAAAAILQRHIEIFEYIAGETDLKWEEIMAPAYVTVTGPNLQLVRIGNDHYHVGITMEKAVAEAYRTQTAEMVDMLYNHSKQRTNGGPPPPPPPLPPNLSQHATGRHNIPQSMSRFSIGNAPLLDNGAVDQQEDRGASDTNQSSDGSDSDDSADSSQKRAKKRITPDAKYQFLGDDLGYLRLKPKKRVIKNKLRNNKQKKWVMSMKRHWNTTKKNKCMEAITIKRSDLSKVTIVTKYVAQLPVTNIVYLLLVLCRCTRDCMKMECALFRIFLTAPMTLIQRTMTHIQKLYSSVLQHKLRGLRKQIGRATLFTMGSQDLPSRLDTIPCTRRVIRNTRARRLKDR